MTTDDLKRTHIGTGQLAKGGYPFNGGTPFSRPSLPPFHVRTPFSNIKLQLRMSTAPPAAAAYIVQAECEDTLSTLPPPDPPLNFHILAETVYRYKPKQENPRNSTLAVTVSGAA